MSRIIHILSVMIGVLSVFVGVNAFADEQQQTTRITTSTTPNGTVVERREIITTTPAPKEVLPSPAGYVSCFTVKAGWYQDIWVADHNVCTYSNSSNGMVWVEGYWTCNKYDGAQGQCTNWDWKSAHWEKTVTVY